MFEHVLEGCHCEGKVCSKCKQKKCHDAFGRSKKEWDGYQYHCKACQKAYRDANAENQHAREKVYRAIHAEHDRVRIRVWRAAHPDQTHAQQQRHHNNHRKTRNAQARVRGRAHYQANPEMYKAHVHTRRARKLANGGKYTAAEWQSLKAKYDYCCLCCGKQEPEIKLTPDHVIPLVKGGSNDISNIQPLCVSCNNGKRARIIDYRT